MAGALLDRTMTPKRHNTPLTIADHRAEKGSHGSLPKRLSWRMSEMDAFRKVFIVALAIASGLVIGLVIASGKGLSPSLEAASSSEAPVMSIPSWSGIAQAVVPAVVNVSSERTVRQSRTNGEFYGPMDEFFKEFFRFRGIPEERKQRSLGSGFIIDAAGYILTNNHVVQSADAKIMVRLSDDSEYKAEIIGVDPETDLALLKIEPKEELSVLELGDSNALNVGDWVMAVGNPLGFDRTVTVGVVSALGRSNLRFGRQSPAYQDYIQTDASINFGNSGGPLVDTLGRVIGVNAAISTPTGGNVGIGFAIPVNLAHEVIDQLKDHGKVVRGWLGVQIGKLSNDLAEGLSLEGVEGVLINDVFKDSPAAKGGLEVGDVVLKVDGEPVVTPEDLQFKVARLSVGSKVELEVNRNGKIKRLKVTLGERPSDLSQISSESPSASWLGCEVVDIDSPEARQLGVDADEGVVIINVNRGSAAEEAGLRRGDVVTKVGHEKVRSVTHYHDLIDQARESGKPAVLLVKGATGSRFVPIKPEDE